MPYFDAILWTPSCVGHRRGLEALTYHGALALEEVRMRVCLPIWRRPPSTGAAAEMIVLSGCTRGGSTEWMYW